MKMASSRSVLAIGSVLLLLRDEHKHSTTLACVAWALVLWVCEWLLLARRSSPPTWGDFLLTLCALTLSLGEGVRVAVGVDARFALIMVLMASVVMGSVFKLSSSVVFHPMLCVLLGLSAVSALVVFALVERQEEAFASFAWGYAWPLFFEVDYVVSLSEGHPVLLGVCLLTAFVGGMNMMGMWPFLFFVFPCLCAWQRQRFLVFAKMLGELRQEKMLYCVACVGVLALCCVVYEPMVQTLLCVHFVLRWRHVLFIKRIYSS
jgi:hypothetical protein